MHIRSGETVSALIQRNLLSSAKFAERSTPWVCSMSQVWETAMAGGQSTIELRRRFEAVSHPELQVTSPPAGLDAPSI
jgi:hypothetical protein